MCRSHLRPGFGKRICSDKSGFPILSMRGQLLLSFCCMGAPGVHRFLREWLCPSQACPEFTTKPCARCCDRRLGETCQISNECCDPAAWLKSLCHRTTATNQIQSRPATSGCAGATGSCCLSHLSPQLCELVVLPSLRFAVRGLYQSQPGFAVPRLKHFNREPLGALATRQSQACGWLQSFLGEPRRVPGTRRKLRLGASVPVSSRHSIES